MKVFHYYPASAEEIQPRKQTAFSILLIIHATISKCRLLSPGCILQKARFESSGLRDTKIKSVPMDYFNLKTKLKSHRDFQHTSFIEKVKKVDFVLK